MARTIAKDHDEKRAALLATAAEFFAENGYDRASMNELAKACGVSKALIYHYYESKDALLFDILDTHLSDLLEAIEDLPQTGDPQRDLLKLNQTILAAYRDADAEHKVQIGALEALPEDNQRKLKGIQRRLVAVMADRIETTAPELFAKRSDLVKPVAMSAFGMLNWFYMWHRDDAGLPREAYAGLVTDLILGGLARIAEGKSKTLETAG